MMWLTNWVRRVGIGLSVVSAGVGMFQTIALANATPPGSTQSPLCPAELAPAIAAITERPEFQRFRWGIAVETLAEEPRDRRSLYTTNAEQYFIPASTVKLFTTAAALVQLGPEYRIRTSVYAAPAIAPVAAAPAADASVATATAPTVLNVYGRGDPSVTLADLAQLAQQIREQGLTHIDHLVMTDQFFQGNAVNLNWEWEDVQAGYGAAVTSLILNENELVLDLLPQAIGEPLAVQWRDPAQTQRWQLDNRSRTVAADAPEFVQIGREIGAEIVRIEGQLRVGSAPEDASISVPNPALYVGEQLQQALAEAGVTVTTLQVAAPEAAQAAAVDTMVELAALDSPPLTDLIAIANQRSTNLYAEVLLKHLGHAASATVPADSTAAGLAALPQILAPLGVDPNTYQLADGSGLSRHNLVSPQALVQVLQAMAAHPDADLYRDSLAVAGEQGTLSYRFRDTAIAGRFWGKSGTVSGNAALAGYLDLPHQPPMALAIILNQTTLRGSAMRAAIDEVVTQIARVQACPTEPFP